MCCGRVESPKFEGKVYEWGRTTGAVSLIWAQLFGCSGPKEHTLISPFETPVNIICEAINPVPLLRMFFGGRPYGNDFRLPGNAMLLPLHTQTHT